MRDSLLTGFKLWGVRRIERASVMQVAAGVTILVLLSAWHLYAGAVTALVAGIAYGRSRHRQARERRPIRRGRGWWFAGQRLRLAPFTEAHRMTTEEVIAARSDKPDADLILWVIANDGTGEPWIRAQENPGPILTATVTGPIGPGADPYLEAQRLALKGAGVSLADIAVVGWGIDFSGEYPRQVVVAVGHTTAGTNALRNQSRDGPSRYQLVEVHPDSVARVLTTVAPGAWEAAAVRGLVAALEIVHPTGRALLEEKVEEKWRLRMMFDRLNRLTASAEERERSRREEEPHRDPAKVVVLKAVDGVVQHVEERLSQVSHANWGSGRPSRSLSWESTSRTIPNRY